jgi:hypothetical protein
LAETVAVGRTEHCWGGVSFGTSAGMNSNSWLEHTSNVAGML